MVGVAVGVTDGVTDGVDDELSVPEADGDAVDDELSVPEADVVEVRVVMWVAELVRVNPAAPWKKSTNITTSCARAIWH